MKWMILAVALICGFLHAESLPTKKIKKYKYELSICAIFKNEEKYLKEWIEYHRMIGVDHFYLYNNNSADAFRKVLHPYIHSGCVTLVSWPDYWSNLTEDTAYLWTIGTQVQAYENAACVRASKETKWLVFLDVDEYLVPNDGKNLLPDILNKYKDSD